MKNLIISISVFAVIASNAQVKLTVKDSVKIQKHEIGVNLIPIVNILGGALPGEATRYSFNYRYFTDAKNAYRTSVSVFPIENYNTLKQSGSLSFYQLSDTTLIYKQSANKQKAKTQLSIGYERIFWRKRLIQSFGADSYISYQHLESKDLYYWIGKSTPVNNIYQPITNSNIVDSLGGNRVIDRIGSGVHFFYNLRLPISKHWLLSTTIGPSISVNYLREKYTPKNTGISNKLQYSNMDFEAILFSDLSICYKF